MNYDAMPSRGKVTSDGEYTRSCWCKGRCYVHYDENRWYRVECEHCGDIVKYKARSHDWAIKMWNDMPDPIGCDESTERNFQFRSEYELRIVKNFMDCMTKAYAKRTLNWCVIRDILMHRTSTAGMTSSCEKCRALGIDPFGYGLKDEK